MIIAYTMKKEFLNNNLKIIKRLSFFKRILSINYDKPFINWIDVFVEIK